ncbi:FUSC family protein [Propioniciclava coleopterorum]|uniref:FUSC family protein n=1 Tax=Propioniciclava coleopterorum TaxID=2714937 RepID=A0A6G7Y2N2_9ACTN|nr:FUSC family protein [Propioniciclava coleopterorum]QIK71033.1 FUSC family protein [Propioniciclava coleopterorum]
MARRSHSRVRRWGVFLLGEIRTGLRRVRGSFVPIAESALAAALAWLFAEFVLGRQNPMFASIAAFMCLGFKVDRVPRKVAELGVGATVGVLIGEVIALTLHTGWWQMGIALISGALVGRFLDRGDLTTMQGGVNAMVVVGMSYWQTLQGGFTARWLDAIVGALVALVFAVLLPRHPTERPRRYAATTLSELAEQLDMLGRGLIVGDVEELADAREQRKVVTQVSNTWETTVATARDVVAANPSLWRQRGEVGELQRLYRLTVRAQRSTYMLGRQGLSMAEEVGPLREVGALVLDAARATFALSGAVGAWHQPEHARSVLLGVARRASPGRLGIDEWRDIALMSVVRALIVDLLQISGLSRVEARDALAEATDRPYGEPETDLPASDSDDEASPLWG